MSIRSFSSMASTQVYSHCIITVQRILRRNLVDCGCLVEKRDLNCGTLANLTSTTAFANGKVPSVSHQKPYFQALPSLITMLVEQANRCRPELGHCVEASIQPISQIVGRRSSSRR